MKSFLLLVLAALIFVSCKTGLNAAKEDSQSLSRGEGKAVELLVRDIKPFVRPLDRDIRIYHWYPKNSWFGAKTRSKKLIKRYKSYSKLRKQVEKVSPYDPNDPPLMMGDGFYAAVDPKQTQGYGGGGSKATLLELIVPKGSLVWDTRVFGSRDEDPSGVFLLSPETFDYLKNGVCKGIKVSMPDIQFAGHSFKVVHLFEFAKNRSCFNTYIKSLEKLNIGLLAYSYFNNELKLCAADSTYHEQSTAFVVLKTSFLKKMNVFTRKVDKSKKEDYLRMNYLLKLEDNEGPGGDYWEEFSSTMKPEYLDEWALNSFYGCNTTATGGPHLNDRLPKYKVFPSDIIR